MFDGEGKRKKERKNIEREREREEEGGIQEEMRFQGRPLRR
jgi:hypothetical protein